MKIVYGPSGAGKSRLLKIISGFISADRGTIYLDGKPMSQFSPRKWRTQVVLLHQEPKMFPGTIKDNLTLAPEYHGFSVQPEKFLKQFELEVDLNQPAHTLSGGEKKRLALARAWAMKPRYFLLDEPTTSLDQNRKIAIDELFLSIVDRSDVGVIWVTHDQDEAVRLGSNGYLLKNGEWNSLRESELKENNNGADH